MQRRDTCEHVGCAVTAAHLCLLPRLGCREAQQDTTNVTASRHCIANTPLTLLQGCIWRVQAVVLDGGRQGLGYASGGQSMERKPSGASAVGMRR